MVENNNLSENNLSKEGNTAINSGENSSIKIKRHQETKNSTSDKVRVTASMSNAHNTPFTSEIILWGKQLNQPKDRVQIQKGGQLNYFNLLAST